MNEEVIIATEACFQDKDKSFYKTGTKTLIKRRNDCVVLESDRVANKN